MSTDIVEKLVGIVLADSGMASVADEGHLIAHTAWDALDQSDKDYILKLTDQDLESILCGINDEDEDFNILWEVGGEWITLPGNVEKFLDAVHNAVTGHY